MGAEGGEEVGEERALSWHGDVECTVIREGCYVYELMSG